MNDKCVIEHKKEIAKCLGRPLIQTNPNEVLKFSFLLKSLDFFLHFFFWFFFFFWSFEGFCESWLYGQIMERRIL
jgi:hypothetical protein